MTETTPCVRYPDVFLHRLLDDAATPQTRSERQEQDMATARAEALCARCPLLATCLTDAVTKYDVAGFVAGTTRRQRQAIRARLAVEVAAEDFDPLVGVRSGRQYDPYEILRLREENPRQPLSRLAAKLGCSVSTIKRHLRRIEEEGLTTPPARPAPTAVEVMAVASDVIRASRGEVAA